MPLTADRERAILREYESVLRDAERDLQDLRDLVDRLRRRVGAATPAGLSGKADATPRPTRTRYRGRVSLPSFLVSLMSDGEERTLDEIEQCVRSNEAFSESPPARNTIATRLNELARKPDTFFKLPGGSYQRLTVEELESARGELIASSTWSAQASNPFVEPETS